MTLLRCISLIVLLATPCFARDQIVDFSDNSLPKINDELRQVNDNIDNKVRDEGDTTAVNFALASFTTDGAWHDLDLSRIIPKGVKWVILQVEVKDGAAGSTMLFRKNGNYGAINISSIATQVANVSTYADLMVQVDKDGKIEYKGSNLVFTTINVTVKGTIK